MFEYIWKILKALVKYLLLTYNSSEFYELETVIYPNTIFKDNSGALSLCTKGNFSGRNKHKDVSIR